jgi:hypothetical protein
VLSERPWTQAGCARQMLGGPEGPESLQSSLQVTLQNTGLPALESRLHFSRQAFAAEAFLQCPVFCFCMEEPRGGWVLIISLMKSGVGCSGWCGSVPKRHGLPRPWYLGSG